MIVTAFTKDPGSGNTSHSAAHTFPANTNVVLLGIVVTDAPAITGVTIGGITATLVSSTNVVGSFGCTHIYMASGALGGSQTVSVQIDASKSVGWTAWACEDASTTLGASGGNATDLVTLAAATGDVVLDVILAYNNTGTGSLTAGAGQTSDWSGAGLTRLWAASREPGAASVDMSWTVSGANNITHSAVVVKPAPTAPSDPSGLSATVAGQKVDLAWTDNSANETGFEIDRAPDVALTGTVTTDGTTALAGTGTLFTTELAVGTKLRIGTAADVYEVQSITSDTALTLTAAAAAQSGVAASKPGAYALIHTTAAGVATYQDAGVSAATRYWWQVRATNSGGDSANSNTVHALSRSAPTATINHPAASGEKASEGLKIALEGTGSDPDAGALTYAWSSSVDGALGSTANVQVVLSGTDASPVSHTITLTVTDPDGDTGTDTVTITSGVSATTSASTEEDEMFLRPYGLAATLVFALRDTNGNPVAGLTFAAGDALVSKDGAAFANAGSLPTGIGQGFYTLSLTAAELQAARVAILVKDADGSAWKAKTIVVETTDHPSAAHPNGVEAAGTAGAAYAAGATSLSLTVAAGTLRQHQPIAFENGAMAVVSAITGSGPYTVTLAAPGLTGSVSSGEGFASYLGAGPDTVSVRTEMDANSTRLANLDALVSTRLAAASYTAPDNATITAISGYVDELETRLTAARALALDNLDAAVSSRAATGAAMALTTAERDAVAGALFDLAAAVDGFTLRQILRGVSAVLLGRVSGQSTDAPAFRDLGNTKDRVVAATDADGNRTAVTLDLA